MLFHTLQYALFFSIVFLAYYLCPQKYCKYILLVFSFLFYSCWSLVFVPVLIYVIAVSYLFGRLSYRRIERGTAGGGNSGSDEQKSRFIPAAGIILLLLPLLYWKYAAFLMSTAVKLIPAVSIRVPEMSAAPVGISFYTFMAVSYVSDVWRNRIHAEKSILNYALAIAFFPHLTSGPIDRPAELLPQINKDREFQYERAVQGIRMIALGLFEKICIADMLTPVTDAAFNRYETFPGSVLLLISFLYTVQLYTDFAGYSYMAAGSARILGFDLHTNFRQPLFAASLGEFWSRWHMSLSSWFRDYIYIPLGGNRKGTFIKCRNLVVTMLLSGIWHGAGWKFVLWGAGHGFLQAMGTLWNEILKKRPAGIPSAKGYKAVHLLRVLRTFVLFSLLLIFFRADSASDAVNYMKKMAMSFQPERFKPELLSLLDPLLMLILAAGFLALLVIDIIHEKNFHIQDLLGRAPGWMRWTVYTGIFLVIFLMYMYHFGEDASGFIYTRF